MRIRKELQIDSFGRCGRTDDWTTRGLVEGKIIETAAHIEGFEL